MTDSLLLFVTLTALVLLSRGVNCSSSYYRVIVSSANNGLFTLRCRLGFVSFQGTPRWLYNGLDYTENEECFARAIRNGAMLQFNLTSECDGYIQCGNETEYSQPLKLRAPLQWTPEYRSGNVIIRKAIGSSVQLPCNVRVSGIEDEHRSVRWFMRNTFGGNSETIPNDYYNDDYSLMLNDLELSSKVYSCRVSTNSDTIEGQFFQLTVVDYMHPEINSLTATTQEEDSNTLTFTLSAIGSQLNYTWYLDDSIITNGIQTNPQTQAGTSILRLLPQQLDGNRNLKNLSVIISNNDTTTGDAAGSARHDSMTVWLYPYVISPDTTTTTAGTSLPTLTVTPSPESFIERHMFYFAGGIGAACIIIILILLLVLGCTCVVCICRCKSKKMKNKCVVFTEEDAESVDSFISKMLALLRKVDRMEQVHVPQEVQDGIVQIRKCLGGILRGDEPHEYTEMDPPPLPPANPNQYTNNNPHTNTNNSYGVITASPSINIPPPTSNGNGTLPAVSHTPTTNVSCDGPSTRPNNIATDGLQEEQVLDCPTRRQQVTNNCYEEIRCLQASPSTNRSYEYEIRPAELNIVTPQGAPNNYIAIPLDHMPTQHRPRKQIKKETLIRLFPQTVVQIKTDCPMNS